MKVPAPPAGSPIQLLLLLLMPNFPLRLLSHFPSRSTSRATRQDASRATVPGGRQVWPGACLPMENCPKRAAAASPKPLGGAGHNSPGRPPTPARRPGVSVPGAAGGGADAAGHEGCHHLCAALGLGLHPVGGCWGQGRGAGAKGPACWVRCGARASAKGCNAPVHTQTLPSPLCCAAVTGPPCRSLMAKRLRVKKAHFAAPPLHHAVHARQALQRRQRRGPAEGHRLAGRGGAQAGVCVPHRWAQLLPAVQAGGGGRRRLHCLAAPIACLRCRMYCLYWPQFCMGLHRAASDESGK